MSEPTPNPDVVALRAYARWTTEVPADFLVVHLAAALRDLQRDTGLTAAPTGQAEAWVEARLARAYALALPFLHSFTVDGAAHVGRLMGNAEFQFLAADEALALADRENERYRRLVDALTPDGAADATTAHGGRFTWIGLGGD